MIKYVGSDTSVMNGTFVKADWYYDSNTGLNITRVYVIGVPGDVANITNASLRVCNRYDVSVKIRTTDVSLLQDINARHLQYVAVRIVDPPSAADVAYQINIEKVPQQ